jgi:glycerol uptake facilitator-like aquaporin
MTLARAASSTVAGIRPEHVPAYVAAQLLGAIAATMIFSWLFRPREIPAIEVPMRTSTVR